MIELTLAFLEVDRQELKQALKSIAGTASDTGEIVLTYDGEDLRLDLGGVTGLASAAGRWPGMVRLSAAGLLRLRNALPDDDPLELRVHQGKLRVGTVSMPCEWEGMTDPINVGMNPRLGDLAVLPRVHSWDRIRASGLEEDVREALDETRDRIRRAARSLRELGVTSDQIRQLVEDALGRRAEILRDETESAS